MCNLKKIINIFLIYLNLNNNTYLSGKLNLIVKNDKQPKLLNKKINKSSEIYIRIEFLYLKAMEEAPNFNLSKQMCRYKLQEIFLRNTKS